MRYKKLVVVLAVALVLAIALPFSKLVSGSPVLFKVPDLNSIRGRPLVLVLNPFRDKAPERTAHEFLEGLREGRCLDLVHSFSRDKAPEICEKQLRYPLVEWTLLDLDKTNGTYSVVYEHRSQNAIGCEEMKVWVDRNEESWKVVGFVIGY